MIENSKLWCRGYEGWHLYKDFYGNVESVEAEFSVTCDNFYIGVGLNISFWGNYQLRVTDMFWQANGRYALALIKREGAVKILDSVFLDEAGVELMKKQWFRLRLEFKNGELCAYINEKLLLQYDDRNAEQMFTIGETGVLLQPESGGNEFRNFSVSGTRQGLQTKCQNEIEPTNYQIDFTKCKVGDEPSDWNCVPYAKKWSISECADKKCLSSDAHESSSITWLHLFENNPTIRLNLTVKKSHQGRFGVVFRYAPETAYIKVGFDFEKESWFVEDTPALYDCQTNITYSPKQMCDLETDLQLEICSTDNRIELFVNKHVVISTEVRQVGYGKIGLFSEKTEVGVYDFYTLLPSGDEVLPEVYICTVPGDEWACSMEMEETKGGKIVGVKKTGVYCSDDEGLSFYKAGTEFDGMETHGYYQSILELQSGKYLQVLLNKGTEVQISADLQNWETIGRVMAIDEQYNENGIFNVLYHVSSLSEISMPNGKQRIFLPIGFQTGELDKPGCLYRKFGHDTLVYYSDDGGVTWQHSENRIYDLLQFSEEEILPEWCESKIVGCKDGSIRLYASRTRSRYLCYTESMDYGKTWSRIYEVPEMQCPLASIGVCEDKFEKGTYYMCWVNNAPHCYGGGHPRIRLSLARSRDGKNWSYLCDVERNCMRLSDTPEMLYTPLFQIIDPCIYVNEKYVFISFGSSVRGAKSRKWATDQSSHNEQRIKVVRFKKYYLKERPWSGANINDVFAMEESKNSLKEVKKL